MESSTHAMLELRLHGYPDLLVAGRSIGLQLKRGLALLAYLAESARPVSRLQAARLLWPDAGESLARGRLRRLVHEINNAAATAVIGGDADRLELAPGPALASDVAVVQATAQRVLQPAAVPGRAEVLQLLQPATAQFLDGFSIGVDTFQDWVDRHRGLHEKLVGRALLRIAELGAAGDPQFACEAAERVIALDPCCERAYSALIAAQVRLGDRPAAETTYFRCAEVLRRELGVKPSPDFESAYARACGGAGAAEVHVQAPPIRFAQTSDGAVAFMAHGAGSQTLLTIPGLFSHIGVSWDDPRVRAVHQRLGRNHRVLMMDRRGTGLSERVGITPSTDAAIEDMLAVLDAEGVERVWVLGASVGGTIGIEFAHRHPQRCRGLLLYGANARGAWAPDHPWSMTQDAVNRWIEVLRNDWGGATSLGLFAPSSAGDPQVRSWWARLLREATSQNSLAALVRNFHAMDVRPLLPGLRLPTLVVHRDGDRIVRRGAGEQLAAAIPGARFVLLPGDDHFFWHGDSDSVLGAMEDFIRAHPGA